MDRNQAIVTTLLMSFLLSSVAGLYELFSKQCKPVHHNCVIRGVSLAKARPESRLQQGSKIAIHLQAPVATSNGIMILRGFRIGIFICCT